MRMILTVALLALTTACWAQPDHAPSGGQIPKDGKKKSKAAALAAVPGLTRTGFLTGVAESSGLALADDANTFYTHGDHGNPPALYRINWEGTVLSHLTVPGTANQDWESLAHDNSGRLYIADVGNNANDRQNLTIYRFDPKQPAVPAVAINFRYADQTAFPPTDKAARNFDCESVVWHDNVLYLFTRDRGRHRHCRVYALPDTPGTGRLAKPVGEYELNGEISGADLSPDGSHLALIGREQLFLITLPTSSILGGAVHSIPLPGAGQTEAVVFTDDQTLCISTEQGALYRYVVK